MGTRSVICIYYKGRFVVAQYTQFDGYPEGQGLVIFKFLKDPTNLIHLKEGLEHHIYTPTKDELKEIDEKIEKIERETREREMANGTFTFGIRGPLATYYPSLAREIGGRIFHMIATAGSSTSGVEPTAQTKAMAEALSENPETDAIAKGDKLVPLSLDLEFANDSLFCEWAYVLDLDTNVFEVFGGSQSKAKATSKRFNDVGDENSRVPMLVKSFGLDTLPSVEGYLGSFRDLHLEDDEEAEADGTGERGEGGE